MLLGKSVDYFFLHFDEVSVLCNKIFTRFGMCWVVPKRIIDLFAYCWKFGRLRVLRFGK
jgi:hypothetical protein